MTDTPAQKPRWYRLTPDRLVLLLLVVEGLLWLSDRLSWPEWHKGYAVLVAVASVGGFLLLTLLWFIAALVFRRRFQFSIRSLLVLTVAVALPCSWMAVEMKKAREHKEAVAAIGKLGGHVAFGYQFGCGGALPNPQPPGPAWLRKLVGDHFFIDVLEVDLNSSQVTDDDLKHVKDLSELGMLRLDDTQITDAGLEHLKGLNRLGILWLSGTKISDAALDRLKGLTKLQLLLLTSTQVTDAGLEHLTGLAHLQFLSVLGTHVTAEGANKLQEELPNCKVHR